MRLYIKQFIITAACAPLAVISARVPPPPASSVLCSGLNNNGNIRVGVDHSQNDFPTFKLNGNNFMPRGIMIRGFVSSIDTAKALGYYSTVGAQKAYGQNELDYAVNNFHANMLRFQVSQADLDPNYVVQPTTNYTPPAGYKKDYRDALIAAIKLARQNCFIVIISMQAEDKSGANPNENRAPLPTGNTIDAWGNLLRGDDGQSLATDNGIMLEIYNEPGGDNTADNWEQWAHAGQPGAHANDSDSGRQLYGMQFMINYMRRPLNNPLDPSGGVGSTNVLLLDGLKLSDTFDGVDGLIRPIHDPYDNPEGHDQIAYAIHPYLRIVGSNAFDNHYATKWGFLHQAGPQPAPYTRPPVVVLSTEWSAGESTKTQGLGLGYPESKTAEVVKLLNYMINNQVPMGAGEMDIPGIMSQGVPANGNDFSMTGTGCPGWLPTNYDNYNQSCCLDGVNNAGLFIANMFGSRYMRNLDESDGVDGGIHWCNQCPNGASECSRMH